jgi:hypothetical protein
LEAAPVIGLLVPMLSYKLANFIGALASEFKVRRLYCPVFESRRAILDGETATA